MQVRGDLVMITGGCGGIGIVVAEEFLKLGKKVLLCDLVTQAGLDLAKKYDGVECVEVDLGDHNEIDRRLKPLIDSGKAPDILVNCVGIITKKKGTAESPKIWDLDVEQWNRVLAVNLTAYFYCCKLILPAMMKNGYGRIVNIASRAGRTGGFVMPVDYVASKAGVIGLTKVMAREAAPYGITVNAINPSRVNTPNMGGDVPPEHLEAYAKNVPLGRIGLPEDIANGILFLVSDLAAYITGETLEVNGGVSMD